jgi:hypothetical protein
VVQDKAEWPAGFGIASSEISAKDRGWHPFLLEVPNLTCPAEVPLRNGPFAIFEMGPKVWKPLPYFLFGQAAIQKEKLTIQYRDSFLITIDLVFRDVTGLGRIGRKNSIGSWRASIWSRVRMKKLLSPVAIARLIVKRSESGWH